MSILKEAMSKFGSYRRPMDPKLKRHRYRVGDVIWVVKSRKSGFEGNIKEVKADDIIIVVTKAGKEVAVHKSDTRPLLKEGG